MQRISTMIEIYDLNSCSSDDYANPSIAHDIRQRVTKKNYYYYCYYDHYFPRRRCVVHSPRCNNNIIYRKWSPRRVPTWQILHSYARPNTVCRWARAEKCCFCVAGPVLRSVVSAATAFERANRLGKINKSSRGSKYGHSQVNRFL